MSKLRPPEGKFFSHVYVDHELPTQDSPRMRARLGVLLNDMGPPRFQKWTESKFGISICTADWRDFLKQADLKDVLDTVTLAYRALASGPCIDRCDERFVRYVNAIFREENVHYAVDRKGGVHFTIDKAFTANQTVTLVGLNLPRYTYVRAKFEQVDAALSDVPPDGRGAVRAAFDAAEAIFRLMFVEEGRLANGPAKNQLGPAFQQFYESNAPALQAALKEVEAFSNWTDACLNYRHANGEGEPLAPPLDLAVQLVGAGSTYIRWLVELDAWRLKRNLGA